MKVVLASASIRRQELLKRVVEDFEIKVSGFEEEVVQFKGDLGEYVMEIACGKAMEVASKYEDALIIGCDTIVALKNEILGKPKDEEEAIEMLKKLSGRDHQVYSGLSLIESKSGNVIKDFVVTHVRFSELTDEEIKKYVNTKDPMDKAGAYGIQGKAGVFVEEIRGDYYSVVGLPLNKLHKMLGSFDLGV